MSHESSSQHEGPGIGDKMNNAQERLLEFASRFRDRASQLGATVSEKVDRKRATAADGLDRAASSLHNRVGSAANRAHGVVHGIESTADYLRNHRLADMGNDFKDVCRRNPISAVISAAFVGFVLGRTLRRR
ncbi:MAG TPA: hypothetical protein VFY29_05810 [Terriglobia bacterium]|nr:hypothetical protein [Terriglobia bacterium]